MWGFQRLRTKTNRGEWISGANNGILKIKQSTQSRYCETVLVGREIEFLLHHFGLNPGVHCRRIGQ